MKALIVKTVFLNSPEEESLEEFINEFIDICANYNMSFTDVCEIFEKISIFSTENNPLI